MRHSFTKYAFAAAVFIYVLAALGMPVYLHYCGGEVEEISYLVKAGSCCDGEDTEENDCCHDEGVVLQYQEDFTLKTPGSDLILAVIDLPSFHKPQNNFSFSSYTLFTHTEHVLPPLQQAEINAVTVLRI